MFSRSGAITGRKVKYLGLCCHGAISNASHPPYPQLIHISHKYHVGKTISHPCPNPDYIIRLLYNPSIIVDWIVCQEVLISCNPFQLLICLIITVMTLSNLYTFFIHYIFSLLLSPQFWAFLAFCHIYYPPFISYYECYLQCFEAGFFHCLILLSHWIESGLPIDGEFHLFHSLLSQ